MTLEEAVQWCCEHCVFVDFYMLDDMPEMIIYTQNGYDYEVLGRSQTLIEAVQNAKANMEGSA